MTDDSDQSATTTHVFNPVDFMRTRHPDLFSDTRIEAVARLPQATFEHHIDTITNRKQEYLFEHLCRKISERELCPNLRPQTGPTGGGDSKVDSETYPVAAEIAERWWVGTPSAGSERWAFAFSAKRQWTAKVRSDVEKIKSTPREYTLIYFLTNQYAIDRTRSALEDELSNEANVPVRILDRAWLIEKVYNSDDTLFEDYLSAIGIEDVPRVDRNHLGPQDTSKLDQLEVLDRQVANPDRYRGARYQLVEDCLRSAILARGLERDRSEVDARFLQAERFAQQSDFRPQLLRIAYNRAWTAFWWHQDYTDFLALYSVVESRIDGSDPNDIDLLVNLWLLIIPSILAGHFDEDDSHVSSRMTHLRSLLTSIMSDSNRPNSALQARTSLTLINMVQAQYSGDKGEILNGVSELAGIVDDATGLGSYSLEHLYRLVEELGEHIDGPEFDDLYDKLIATLGDQRSDGEAGIAYAKRASPGLYA